MICEKHTAFVKHDYCVFCALEDKIKEQAALWKEELEEELEKWEAAWETATNLYPDIESISPFRSERT